MFPYFSFQMIHDGIYYVAISLSTEYSAYLV